MQLIRGPSLLLVFYFLIDQINRWKKNVGLRYNKEKSQMVLCQITQKYNGLGHELSKFQQIGLKIIWPRLWNKQDSHPVAEIG